MQQLVLPTHRPTPVEVMRKELRRVCGVFDIEPSHSSNGIISGDISLRHMGSFDAAVVALDASRVVRDSRAIRRDPGEHLFLLLQDEGHCRIEQNGKSTLLSPGDMFLVDAGKPSCFIYDGERSNQLSFHLSRDEMMHRYGEVCTGGLAIERQDPLWLALRAVISKIVAMPNASLPLQEALFGLFGAYFHDLRASAGSRDTVLSRALALIDRHAMDPSYSARELAFHLNVSERTLQRHFEPLGETPSRRLMKRRLELARSRLIADGNGRAPNGIAAIAYECGFNDLSYFYREFRKQYGETPGKVRH
ncbi:helix-turn-helix domain-containing protein [Agrobacterium larrymoorei]|uniref:Helix-turn-helix domain-containing protein n=1 Tax=Agrobacterium larrymoorei TaxID=160699 RepID=A0A4D7E557_9HYPH|nr:helix-turn-helix domain-containing protein [Agrobacterium larrymoorei]QCJ00281.1 helix-turn-helix domain-containing protein [Agrobacterium larrymoorei]QYA09277.1 helix-turn-helix domain-containing protein [Agrobacterium larrymoorei]